MGDTEAVVVLEEAAREAAGRAPATAAHWFLAAQELLPDEPEATARQQELLLGAAVTLGFAGELAESSQLFHRLLDGLPEGASPLRTATIGFRAFVEHLLGNHEQAEQLVLARLDEIDDDSEEAVEARLELAWGGFFAADWEGMDRWARKALAADPPDPTLQAVGRALPCDSACNLPGFRRGIVGLAVRCRDRSAQNGHRRDKNKFRTVGRDYRDAARRVVRQARPERSGFHARVRQCCRTCRH